MNPFGEIIEAMREEGKHYNVPSFYFAKVTSSYPNLKVKFDDIELDRNILLVDKWLLDRQKQIYTEATSSHEHTINALTDLLKVGDRVVLIRDLEKFIIISKVVSI